MKYTKSEILKEIAFYESIYKKHYNDASGLDFAFNVEIQISENEKLKIHIGKNNETQEKNLTESEKLKVIATVEKMLGIGDEDNDCK